MKKYIYLNEDIIDFGTSVIRNFIAPRTFPKAEIYEFNPESDSFVPFVPAIKLPPVEVHISTGHAELETFISDQHLSEEFKDLIGKLQTLTNSLPVIFDVIFFPVLLFSDRFIVDHTVADPQRDPRFKEAVLVSFRKPKPIVYVQETVEERKKGKEILKSLAYEGETFTEHESGYYFLVQMYDYEKIRQHSISQKQIEQLSSAEYISILRKQIIYETEKLHAACEIQAEWDWNSRINIISPDLYADVYPEEEEEDTIEKRIIEQIMKKYQKYPTKEDFDSKINIEISSKYLTIESLPAAHTVRWLQRFYENGELDLETSANVMKSYITFYEKEA